MEKKNNNREYYFWKYFNHRQNIVSEALEPDGRRFALCGF